MSIYPVSVAGWSFHKMREDGLMDIFHYIETAAARYRVDNADILSILLPTQDEEFIRKVRHELDRRGLGVSNFCVDYASPWMPTPEEREENRQKMLRHIRSAQILGATTVRIDFGGKTGEPMSEEAFDVIVARYKEYCKICFDLGMKIGPENHVGFDRDLGNLLKVWKAVDHPAYGHLLHLGNLENFMDNMDVLLPIVMHTHIPANSMTYAKECIRRLAASGYKGTISVEHHSSNLELERTEWQIASVREILAELEQEGFGEPVKQNYMCDIYSGGKGVG